MNMGRVHNNISKIHTILMRLHPEKSSSVNMKTAVEHAFAIEEAYSNNKNDNLTFHYEEWFLTLDSDLQRLILGKKIYDEWKNDWRKFG